ncbi:MAG: chalcone isomerase family protein [Pseudomonadota bacterium]
MQKIGYGTLSIAFWDIYHIGLYSAEKKWSYEVPFQLSIEYLTDIKGADIAERSIEEMRGIGYQDEKQLAVWYKNLKDIFPDVVDGTRLTAEFDPLSAKGVTKFYKNNKPIGEVSGQDFIRAFAGIWLSPKTSEADLREELLKGSQ